MMDTFLELEYEHCISLLARYDDRQLELARYATLLSCAVASIVLGLSTVTGSTKLSWPLVALLSGLTMVALLVVTVGMVQNRLYFVFVARQVNSIRKRETDRLGEDFQNCMYVSTDFSAHQPWSTQQFMLALVGLETGLFAGLLSFSLMALSSEQPPLIVAGLVTVLATAALQSGAGRYLQTKSTINPDAAIHPKDQSPEVCP